MRRDARAVYLQAGSPSLQAMLHNATQTLPGATFSLRGRDATVTRDGASARVTDRDAPPPPRSRPAAPVEPTRDARLSTATRALTVRPLRAAAASSGSPDALARDLWTRLCLVPGAVGYSARSGQFAPTSPERETLVTYRVDELPPVLSRLLPADAPARRCLFWAARSGSLAARALLAAVPEPEIEGADAAMRFASSINRAAALGRGLADALRPAEAGAAGLTVGWYSMGFHGGDADVAEAWLRDAGHDLRPIAPLLADAVFVWITDALGAPTSRVVSRAVVDGSASSSRVDEVTAGTLRAARRRPARRPPLGRRARRRPSLSPEEERGHVTRRPGARRGGGRATAQVASRRRTRGSSSAPRACGDLCDGRAPRGGAPGRPRRLARLPRASSSRRGGARPHRRPLMRRVEICRRARDPGVSDGARRLSRGVRRALSDDSARVDHSVTHRRARGRRVR
ncbi:MAG: hypothetical protein R3A52_21155 [Polyangiales bacterium]